MKTKSLYLFERFTIGVFLTWVLVFFAWMFTREGERSSANLPNPII